MPKTSSPVFSNSHKQIELKETINKLMMVLSEKEKYIIQHRFCIDSETRKTLESIGQHFSVTRERIRQIEKNALKKLKRNAFNTNLKTINETAKGIIKKHGGFLSDKKLMTILLSHFEGLMAKEISALQLSLSIDSEITKANNTLDFEPHWRLQSIPINQIRKISQNGFKHLSSRKQVIPLNELTSLIIESTGIKKLDPALVNSILEVDKRIKFVKEGVGLKEWRDINPRTLRDKIRYIMNREHKPLHFSEIAHKIREAKFDKKNTNDQAVHNELIRNDSFVLIGRGIYALDKWGYQPGTVGDVIAQILSDRKPHTREEIMKGVLKRRLVKKITIYLNLKNDLRIEPLSGDRYQLKNAKKVKIEG